MSFLSKLFGKEVEKAANEFVNAIKNEASSFGDGQTSHTETYAPASAPADELVWSNVPSEENQYNFGANYIDYFKHIFSDDFSDYDVECKLADGRYSEAYVCTFTNSGAKRLVVELMSEKSCAAKLRKECQQAGIPYLRFYYDHEGWWNTRSYVRERISAALNG